MSLNENITLTASILDNVDPIVKLTGVSMVSSKLTFDFETKYGIIDNWSFTVSGEEQEHYENASKAVTVLNELLDTEQFSNVSIYLRKSEVSNNYTLTIDFIFYQTLCRYKVDITKFDYKPVYMFMEKESNLLIEVVPVASDLLTAISLPVSDINIIKGTIPEEEDIDKENPLETFVGLEFEFIKDERCGTIRILKKFYISNRNYDSSPKFVERMNSRMEQFARTLDMLLCSSDQKVKGICRIIKSDTDESLCLESNINGIRDIFTMVRFDGEYLNDQIEDVSPMFIHLPILKSSFSKNENKHSTFKLKKVVEVPYDHIDDEIEKVKYFAPISFGINNLEEDDNSHWSSFKDVYKIVVNHFYNTIELYQSDMDRMISFTYELKSDEEEIEKQRKAIHQLFSNLVEESKKSDERPVLQYSIKFDNDRDKSSGVGSNKLIPILTFMSSSGEELELNYIDQVTE